MKAPPERGDVTRCYQHRSRIRGNGRTLKVHVVLRSYELINPTVLRGVSVYFLTVPLAA